MIYHSDSRAGVPRRGDLAGQVCRLAVIAELVQAGLDHQRRPLGTTQVGFLSRRILGGLGVLACLWLLLLHLRRRWRALVPVQYHCDSAFIVHDFPRWRLIVQLQRMDRLADYFRDRRNCWERERENELSVIRGHGCGGYWWCSVLQGVTISAGDPSQECEIHRS